MASSHASSPRLYHDVDYDDIDSTEFDGDREYDLNFSDEDTEDASETDMAKKETEYTEIKEQMYQDKLAHLKKQLQQLREGTFPEYIKKTKKIDQQYRERLRINEIWRDYELEVIEREYVKEKEAAATEFEEKKIDLKENWVIDLEEKRRHIEGERITMELTGDPMEVKTVTTRKLRRRPNEPPPLPEKRKKNAPPQINFWLDENEILEDLKYIQKVSGKPLSKKPNPPPSPVDTSSDIKIEDGRLYYDKRWFHRNQPVCLESKENGKTSGVITAIGTLEIWIRKTTDNNRVRIYLSQLQKGKFILRRRPT